MTISTGDRLPDATLLRDGAEGPEPVALSEIVAGKTVALFALPGAFTGTCTTAHLPSFIRTKDEFAAKGVDTIICVAVNDPFVMKAWAAQTGADDAGLVMLSDPEATFTRAMGMEFSHPPAGLINRSRRYAAIVEDGVVRTLHVEEGPGVCEASGGEALLAEL
ncbi:Putative peroxiredoxin [Jannaschia seosinensis]|uniref:Glutathione-dependent peroxiredoxin n=1 Tax=Jannaschia seosinensis TaxID=313367 RepID=A0A0M7BC05_9RHOB|nr:peroxiredoxin [Jannaschia seosinensis]CUH38806.1 Putative peroxiredoxin [Jannaschia seosinensis]